MHKLAFSKNQLIYNQFKKKEKEDLFVADKVHLNNKGAKYFASLIAKSLGLEIEYKEDDKSKKKDKNDDIEDREQSDSDEIKNIILSNPD
jgi:uncharacterized membrane protein YkoI